MNDILGELIRFRTPEDVIAELSNRLRVRELTTYRGRVHTMTGGRRMEPYPCWAAPPSIKFTIIQL
jgi:hypothetical protein